MDGERVLVRGPCVASPHHAPARDGERVLVRCSSPGITKKNTPAMERERVLMRHTRPASPKKTHLPWRGSAS